VRLTRVGDTFTGYASEDGTTWRTLGTTTVPMGTTIMVGLTAHSHVRGTLATVVYDSLSVTP
jgi:hypothetical protein